MNKTLLAEGAACELLQQYEKFIECLAPANSSPGLGKIKR